MNVLDLFSGIGGFSLGLERAGMRTVAFCEIDPFARRVLAKHWPDVPCYDDIRTLTADRLQADGISVDAIAGGFPCQDISVAGKGAGLAGERSGLWSEYARIIGELRPRFVIVENVAALLARGIGRVLGDLAALGYDAEWEIISAADVGAPHLRERIWIVANPSSGRCSQSTSGEMEQPRRAEAVGTGEALANTHGSRFQKRFMLPRVSSQTGCDDDGENTSLGSWWLTEPDVGRVAARISTRMDGGRLDANASQGGTGEILRAVRDGVSTPHLQWPARGFGGLQEAEILLNLLCEYEGKTRPLGHVSLACSEASAPIVRGLWFNGQTACPSCRRAATEQRSVEHPDALRLLPQLLACDCGAAWLDATGTASETPRVNRLRSLGNAVVPQVVEIIGRAIMTAHTPADGSGK